MFKRGDAVVRRGLRVLRLYHRRAAPRINICWHLAYIALGNSIRVAHAAHGFRTACLAAQLVLRRGVGDLRHLYQLVRSTQRARRRHQRVGFQTRQRRRAWRTR